MHSRLCLTLKGMPRKKLRVGILFGGKSGEHEVSLRSARSILQAIDRKKYEVVELGITREGRWLPPGTSHALLGDDSRPTQENAKAGQGLTIAAAAAEPGSGAGID